MKQWIAWFLQNKYRKLELSTGGKWYLLFTILLGAVAINSGNNVVYFLESLLLSALILSGILSERTITKIKIKRVISQAKVAERSEDIFVLENTGRIPLYCVEISEVKDGEILPLAFLPIVKGRAKIRIRSNQVFQQRGLYAWQGLAVATSFPYGFAKKIRFIFETKSRIVWPSGEQISEKRTQLEEKSGNEPEISAGEIEEIPAWGDITKVHWPSSQRFQNLMAFPREKQSDAYEVIFNCCPPGGELEKRIVRAAGNLEDIQKRRHVTVLVVREGTSKRKINTSHRAMDYLALLPRAQS